MLIPIIAKPDGRYQLDLFGQDTTIGSDRLAETREKLSNAGQYSFVTTHDEYDDMKADAAKQAKVFNDCMVSVVESWVGLARQRLHGTGIRCYISPGNDDKFEIDSLLTDSEELVNPEGRVVDLDGTHEMITLGYANPTPWHSPREVSEGKLAEMIEGMAARVARPQNAIYNLHVPPIDTDLDKAPAVDSEFRYVREGLSVKMIHAGSSAVRSSIERHAPLLGLHGHIHESKGFVRLGRTLCLNPGSEYADGILRGAIVNLEGGRVKEFMFTSG